MSAAGSDKQHRSHVSERAELVPIKKRKFLYRSCSPPRIYSPQKEKSPRLGEERDQQDQPVTVLTAPSFSKLDDGANLQTDTCHTDPKKVYESLESRDDCLSLLADAACCTGLPMDVDIPEHDSGMKTKVSEGQYEELTANCKMDSLYNEMIKSQVSSKIGIDSSQVTATSIGEEELPSISVPEKHYDTVKPIEKTSCAATFSCQKGEAVEIQREQSQDDRLHWDLNLVMDVWEQPFGCSLAQASDVESGETPNDGKSMKTTEISDRILKPELSKFTDIKQPICEPERQVDQGLRDNSDDCGVTDDERKQPLDICQMSLIMSSSCRNNVPLVHEDHLKGDQIAKSLNLDGTPSNSTDLKFELDKSDDAKVNVTDSSCTGIMRQSIVDEHRCHVKIEQAAESLSSVRVPSDSTDLKLSSDPVSRDICSLKAENITFAENAGVSTFGGGEMGLTGSSHPVILSQGEWFDKKICSEEERDAVTVFPTSHGSRMNVVDMELSCKKEEVPFTPKTEVTTEIVAQSSMTEVMTNPSETTSSFNRSLRINYDEFMELVDKRKAVDTSDQKSNYDISSQHYSNLGFDSEGEPLDGYDSQYEDGELREASGLGWEEYDVSDGEAQHAEYQLNGIDVPSPHIDDCKVKVTSPPISQVNSELTTNSNCPMKEQNDVINKDVDTDVDEGRRSMMSDELLVIKRDSSATETSARDPDERVRTFTRARFIDVDSTGNNARPRGLNRMLPSQVDGQVSCDMTFREERMEATGSRFLRRPRFYVQGQARAGQADGYVGYSDDRRSFRQHHYSTYHEQGNSDAAGAMEEGKDTKLDAAAYIDEPSTTDDFVDDEDLGFLPGSMPNEDQCSTRPMGRGRFLRYGTRMGNGGGRGRYNGSYRDDYQTSMKYRLRPFSQRERSGSPAARRGGYTLNYRPSRGRSPPRLGECSPHPRTSPKGRFEPGSYRDTYARQRGRSPNFRPDLRMMRRSPNLQPGFVTDRERVRPSRTQHFPSPMPKWMCDEKDEVGRFRDFGNMRRDDMSPGRGRGRLHGAFDGAQKSRPDVFYRSPPPARLSEVEGTNRGFRADANYENRRKHFDTPYFSRRSFEHGNERRLRHTDDNVDDHFETSYRNVKEFRGRGRGRGRGMRNIDNRMEDMPRGFRREQQSMYDQDGKFDTGTKSFRFNRMDNSRSMNSSRYVDHYENRRSHPFRSDELDSAGRRIDHGVDGDTGE